MRGNLCKAILYNFRIRLVYIRTFTDKALKIIITIFTKKLNNRICLIIVGKSFGFFF